MNNIDSNRFYKVNSFITHQKRTITLYAQREAN